MHAAQIFMNAAAAEIGLHTRNTPQISDWVLKTCNYHPSRTLSSSVAGKTPQSDPESNESPLILDFLEDLNYNRSKTGAFLTCDPDNLGFRPCCNLPSRRFVTNLYFLLNVTRSYFDLFPFVSEKTPAGIVSMQPARHKWSAGSLYHDRPFKIIVKAVKFYLFWDKIENFRCAHVNLLSLAWTRKCKIKLLQSKGEEFQRYL
jgi:hypothetical protein